MSPAVVALLSVLILAVAGALTAVWMRTRREVTTPTERAVHAALHTASLAARPLRRGLDENSAAEAAPHLRELTGGSGLGLADASGNLLAWDGRHEALSEQFHDAAIRAIEGERRVLVTHSDLVRGPSDHHVRALIAQPLLIEDIGVVGVLGIVTSEDPWPGMLGAVTEVARYACSQIELADLDASRALLDRAEVRALRAQISPHFIYNALNTVASFVRTDPARARELILEFADFTRYSFRSAGEFTLLADELRNIDRYLTLERARFGEALNVRLQIAPEVLNVVLPFLALQPLVENAVRHGISSKPEGGTVSIVLRTRDRTASSASRTTVWGWTPNYCAPVRSTPSSRDRGDPAHEKLLTSVWPTSTTDFVPRSATTTDSWWRQRRVPVRRSACVFPSSSRVFTSDSRLR